MRIVRDATGFRAVYEGHAYRVRQDQKGHYITVKGTRVSCVRAMKAFQVGGAPPPHPSAFRLLDLPDPVLERILSCLNRKHLRAPYTTCKKLKGISLEILEEAFETLQVILEETDLEVIKRDYLEKINAKPVLKKWLIEHCRTLLRDVYHGAHLEPQVMNLATCLNQCDHDYYPVFLRAFLALLGAREPGASPPSPTALRTAKATYDACRALCTQVYGAH